MKAVNKQYGFSLIELLVSLTILTSALAGSYAIVSALVSTIEKSRSVQNIAYLGDKHMNELALKDRLKTGVFQGTYGQGVEWKLTLNRIETYPQAFMVDLQIWDEHSNEDFHTIIFNANTD